MKRRPSRPLPPFDIVPESVVEAARRLFDALRGARRSVATWPFPVERFLND